MRFCDFFFEYKLKVLGISPYIRLNEMEKYKLVGLAIWLISMIIGIISLMFNKNAYWYFYTISIISIIITLLLSNRKKEKEKMLHNHYKPYSKKRMSAFNELLKDYGIDYKDEIKMKMLLEQADLDKDRHSIMKGIKSPINATGTSVIMPILTIILSRVVENIEVSQLLVQTIQWGLILLTVMVIGIAMYSLIRNILGGDYGKYEDLKYDLQQMMLFGDMISE